MSQIRPLYILLLTLCSLSTCVFAQEAGQQTFSSRCSSCHGLDGRGGEHAPNIATNADVQSLPDRDLVHIVRAGTPSAGMPGFASSLDDEQIHSVVGYLRVLQGKAKTGTLVLGDVENGRAIFFGRGGCSTCHTMNGQGGFLGTDLSSYGRVHDADDIRRAIINPNDYLDPRHGTVVVVARNGAKCTGVVRNEDNFSLQMQTADGNFHLFDKAKLKSIEHSPNSMMPTNYQSQLGDKGLNDVISYLIKAASTQAVNAENDEDK